MIVFFASVTFAVAVLLIAKVFRKVIRDGRSLDLILVMLLLVLGCGIGIRVGVGCQYPVGTKSRLEGFPIPVAIYRREETGWIDFVPERPLQYFMSATNIAVWGAVCLLPVLFLPYPRKRSQRIH